MLKDSSQFSDFLELWGRFIFKFKLNKIEFIRVILSRKRFDQKVVNRYYCLYIMVQMFFIFCLTNFGCFLLMHREFEERCQITSYWGFCYNGAKCSLVYLYFTIYFLSNVCIPKLCSSRKRQPPLLASFIILSDSLYC